MPMCNVYVQCLCAMPMCNAGYEKMTFFSSPMRAAEPMIPEPASGPHAMAGQLAPGAIFGSDRSPRRQPVYLCVHSNIV